MMCEVHDQQHFALWRCDECTELMCEEIAAVHRKGKMTKSHQLSPIAPPASAFQDRSKRVANKLPICTQHDKPYYLYDRSCQRLLCGDKCQFMDEHKTCTIVSLLNEKEERIDNDPQLREMCQSVSVTSAVQQLAGHEAECFKLMDAIDQDNESLLQRLEAKKLKVQTFFCKAKVVSMLLLKLGRDAFLIRCTSGLTTRTRQASREPSRCTPSRNDNSIS
jgi:hypothetical protein